MAHHGLILQNPSVSSFAAYDPARKGTGVTLSGGNRTIDISGLYMGCGTNPQTLATANFYNEHHRNSGAFMGCGITISGSLTDQYQGAYAGQCTVWEDGTYDYVSGLDVAPNRPNYSSYTDLKFLFNSNGLFLGRVGVGWWNTTASDWTGDPTVSSNAIIRSISAGAYSFGTTSISSINATTNFGNASFSDSPPGGSVGWPG